MPSEPLPLILEPETLQTQLDKPDLLIVDLCHVQRYQQTHIPGAMHLDYKQIIRAQPPVMGLMPDTDSLSHTLSAIGLQTQTHVIAYDDEGGGRAARLLWTLEMLGHRQYSLLNGGIYAWEAAGMPLTDAVEQRPGSDYHADIRGDASVDKDTVLQQLNDPAVVLLDCRSPEEFNGQKRFALHGGHIPGAVNYDWRQAIDQERALRLKPEAELRAIMEQLGVTPDKLIIPYCQTHHRSSHSFIMLKSLGYSQLKAYVGSWSEWGNLNDTPIA